MSIRRWSALHFTITPGALFPYTSRRVKFSRVSKQYFRCTASRDDDGGISYGGRLRRQYTSSRSLWHQPQVWTWENPNAGGMLRPWQADEDPHTSGIPVVVGCGCGSTWKNSHKYGLVADNQTQQHHSGFSHMARCTALAVEKPAHPVVLEVSAPKQLIDLHIASRRNVAVNTCG